MRERDAKRIYRVVSTYVLAVPAVAVAALSAMAPDLVRLTTTTDFHAAAAVTPWIALGVMFQGNYLVGSTGLVITKRTMLYPVATGTAAAVSLVGYALLIPRFGLLGAAWANALAYGTLAVGKRANFIVLDANPLEDIRNTRRISSVYLDGAKFDREALLARWKKADAAQ